MGLGKVLSKTDTEIRFHGIGLHAYIDVTMLIGCEHIVAELQSYRWIVRTKGPVIVLHFLIGFVEEAKCTFVGIAEMYEVLAASKQTCGEIERLVPVPRP